MTKPFALLLTIVTLQLAACEERPSPPIEPATPQTSGELGGDIDRVKDETASELDAVRESAKKNSPELPGRQNSGKNE